MFDQPIISFTKNLAALRDFVSVIAQLLEQHSSDPINKLTDAFANAMTAILEAVPPEMKAGGVRIALDPKHPSHCRITTDPPGPDQKEILIDRPETQSFSELVRMIDQVKARQDFLHQNSLISLVSFVEWFLCELLKIHFERFTAAADVSDKTLTLKDLTAFGSISDATKYLIDARIDEIMRDSFEGWVRFLRERLKLSMSYLDKDFDGLVEIFQRRNIIIHNGGRANSIYLSKVAPSLRKGIVLNTQLRVSPEYLDESIATLELNMILVCAELWKKVSPEEHSRGEILNQIALAHLKAERWKIGSGLSYFVMNDKQLPERMLLVGQLNYWQGMKWQGRYDEIKGDLEKSDFTAKDELFQLGHLALAEKFKEFFELLPKVYESKKIKKEELLDWPIFREIRKRDEFDKFKRNCSDFLPPEEKPPLPPHPTKLER